MKRPTIKDAQRTCQALGARGVIILAFNADDGGRVAGVSYGVTMPVCRDMGKVLDQIVDRLESGDISSLDGFSGSFEQGGEL